MGLFSRRSGNTGSMDVSSASSRWSRLVGQCSPLALLERAGRSLGVERGRQGQLDTLEKRELLFTLAVTAEDVNAATGLGTVVAHFGYVIPFVASDYDVPDPQQQTQVLDFNQSAYITVPSGFTFPQSVVQVIHNIQPAADIAVTSFTGADVNSQARFLRVDLNQPGEFVEFRPRSQQNAALSRPSDQVSFTVAPFRQAGNVSDNSGIDTDNSRVVLFYDNQVIDVLQGQRLRDALVGNPTLGTGTYTINAPQGQEFDAVRIELVGQFALPGSSAFSVDDVSFRFQAPQFDGLIEPRIFGATVSLTGPVGASVNVRDLYQREMVRTIRLGKLPGSEVLLVDRNDDGIPDFNDGIGSIRLNNVDARSSLTIFGGRITPATDPPAGVDFFEPGFSYTIASTLEGFADDFEGAGFGYVFSIAQNGDGFGVAGLPPVAGTVIIGSPWVRPQSDYLQPREFPAQNFTQFDADDAIVVPDADTSFIRADQGIFVPNGQSMNIINVHGILHGNSQFTGALNQLSVSYLVGSVTVAGDLGSLTTQTDAGSWAVDPDFEFQISGTSLEPLYRTEGSITVGRTVGEIAIAGRGQADITVVGDLNSPLTRPARDSLNYRELEYIEPWTQDTEEIVVIRDWLYQGIVQNFDPLDPDAQFRNGLTQAQAAAIDPTTLVRTRSQSALYGSGWLRNDTLMTAEFIGNAGTSARVRGDLSANNPILGEDVADVYSFAWDGTTELVVQASNDEDGFGAYFRILDAQGRTVAAPEALDPETAAGDPNSRRQFRSSRVKVTPREGAGLYYLVVSDPQGADTGNSTSAYSFFITGMAPTTLGSYRTGAGSGFSTTTGGLSNAITVLSGNVGAVQVGMGFGNGDGDDTASTDLSNTDLSEDDFASFQGGNFTVTGDLYALITGSDLGQPSQGLSTAIVNFDVGGRVGNISTGMSPVYGNGPAAQLAGDGAGERALHGDINGLVMRIRGGGLSSAWVGGAIGFDQDPENANRRSFTGLGWRLNTGDNVRGIAGDIGIIRVGFHVIGAAFGNRPFDITTSDNSTIGAILISQDAYDDTDPRSGIVGGPIGLRTGRNSDVRFVDTPEIDNTGDDAVIPLPGNGGVREFIDDAGARVGISVVGGALANPANVVRVVPIDGGQGVAIAEIVVDLTGGLILRITGSSNGSSDLVTLGRIRVIGDENSRIEFGGTAEIDVYRIEVTGAVQTITNTTVNGDIVTIDAESLDVVEVEGSLGRTQLVAFGPQSIAPFPGVDGGGLSGEVGSGVGTSAGGEARALVDAAVYNGSTYRPTQDDNTGAGNGYRDDIGSPLDGRLEGVIVRGGNVSRIASGQAVVNVILQGGTGILGEVRINDDAITPFGEFEGLLGSIYAFRVGIVDVGDGIASRLDNNPVGAPGVYAADDIGTVTGPTQVTVPGGPSGGPVSTVKPTQISGVISAGNVVPLNLGPIVLRNGFTYDFTTDGINLVTLPGGSFVDSFVSVDTLDSFWTSFNYRENRVFQGDIGLIDVSNAQFTRNRISAFNLPSFVGDGATFDASRIRLGGNLGTMTVRAISNSTLLGTTNEFVPTDIRVQRDIDRITVTEDAQDFAVTNTGDFTGGFNARNLVRGRISTNGRISGVTTTQDVRGSDVQSGQLDSLVVGRNIASSSVEVSGELRTLTIGDRATNTGILISGPDGRLNTVTARNGFQGRIDSSGPITALSVTNGDFDAVVTTTETDGTLTSVTASRDVKISGDIKGSVGTITAGRHIGQLGRVGQALVVQGDITTVSAPNGVLYNDLRAGGRIGTVTLGGALNKPDNDQTGRGSLVAFNGIGTVVANGDFGGDILSYSNGITSVTINGGSFLPDRTIAAYRGSITLLTIAGGDLLGNVYADDDIVSLIVSGIAPGATGPGPFGNIGVDSAKNAGTVADNRRNQLPQGVAATSGLSGALVRAGRDITSITVGGSVFESGFHAGRTITNIAIAGRVSNNSDFGAKGSFFAAGDSIARVSAGINFADTQFIAGLTSLGADNRPGGVGENEDTIKSGTIGTVVSPAGAFGVTFVAGAEAGLDGVYGDDAGTPGDESLDDALALGVSSIGTLNIGGTLANVQVVSDSIPGSIANDGRFSLRRVPGQLADYVLDAGEGFAGTGFTGTRTVSVGAATYTLNFTGPGQAFFTLGVPGGVLSNGLGAPDFTITLRNTNASSGLSVSSNSGTLENLHIWTNNNAALGTLTVGSRLVGNSTVLVDGGVGTLTGQATGSSTNAFGEAFRPQFDIGGDVTRLAFAGLTDGVINARAVAAVAITGDFGGGAGGAAINALSLGTVQITGAARGTLNAETTFTQATITGAGERAQLRAGRTLGPVSIGGQLSRSTISAGRDIGQVAIGGQMFDSSISAGADLGRDAFFGGSGRDADTLRTGSIAGVTVNGDFRESDITAGFLRGPDGFFGTRDDQFAGGRGSIGNVTISGNNTGSPRNTETYRIASNGTIGTVTLGGQTFTGTRANFGLLAPLAAPRAVEIDSLRVTVESFVPTAVVEFNQPMDRSSFSRGLSVAEIRGQGEVEIRLVEGLDYTLDYTENKNALLITFSRALTQADLPVVPGRPGPGVYRIRLDAATVRGRLQDAPFDGDSDGLAGAFDDYAGSVVIGDAGDKLADSSVTSGGQRFDFYAPVNLNFAFDDADAPDGLPEPNRSFTVDGFIGDHPDNNSTSFRFGGDVDLFRLTLQAGQIVQLSSLTGGASGATYRLLNAQGQQVSLIAEGAATVSLPVPDLNAPFDRSAEQAYLIKQTGDYIIALGVLDNIANATTINNPIRTVPGTVGNYSFKVTIFDDGDSGFTSTARSGDGTRVIAAPLPIDFAGNDQTFGTPDDQTSLAIDNYVFTLNRGADNVPNTGDDIVSGESPDGIVSTRQGSRLVQTISSAVGRPNFIGVPSSFQADVDVFHLNNRQPIAPGTKQRITVKLSNSGSDLGSLSIQTTQDLRGAVQFGFFETTTSQLVDDANLIFSATDFRANGGTPNTLLGQSSSTTYGFDANGDYFIEFITPEAQGTANGAGSFAIYLQGIINSDYQIEVVTEGTGSLTRRKQQILLETQGGSIDWLQAGNIPTQLLPLDVRTLGLSGAISTGQPVQTYVLSNLVSGLNTLFQAAGVEVEFSTDPSDFEFQEFSTIYLSSSNDPVNLLFTTFTNFNFLSLAGGGFNALFNPTQPYGVSERSDPFNTRLDDEAVVFLPTLSLLGRTPSQLDIDLLVKSLTAAVARRAGEIMGTRITEGDNPNNAGSIFDPFAANSVDFGRDTEARTINPNFQIPAFSRGLSGNADTVTTTDFFLGRQVGIGILQQNVRRTF